MEWLQVLSALLLVFGLLALFYWLASRYGGRAVGGGSRKIQVLERRSLGDKAQLVLVQVGTETLLLGITPQNVSMLSQLSAEAEPAPADEAFSAPNGPDFRRWLEILK